MRDSQGDVISCWMLLLSSTLPGTQDSWVLLSLLVWGTARDDTHMLVLVSLTQATELSVIALTLSLRCAIVNRLPRKRNLTAWFESPPPLKLKKLCMYTMHFK